MNLYEMIVNAAKTIEEAEVEGTEVTIKVIKGQIQIEVCKSAAKDGSFYLTGYLEPKEGKDE